jgi:hypothetical protein
MNQFFHLLERQLIPRDCSEALSVGGRQSGIYQIRPQLSSVEFFVNCDMETRGGGWTVRIKYTNILKFLGKI